jgi:hypothetical protein
MQCLDLMQAHLVSRASGCLVRPLHALPCGAVIRPMTAVRHTKVANDIDTRFLLSCRTRKTPTTSLMVTVGNAARFPVTFHASSSDSEARGQILFDRIVCDVPCSGALRRSSARPTGAHRLRSHGSAAGQAMARSARTRRSGADGTSRAWALARLRPARRRRRGAALGSAAVGCSYAISLHTRQLKILLRALHLLKVLPRRRPLQASPAFPPALQTRAAAPPLAPLDGRGGRADAAGTAADCLGAVSRRACSREGCSRTRPARSIRSRTRRSFSRRCSATRSVQNDVHR